MPVEVLERDVPYRGRAFTVRRDRVRHPGGHVSTLDIVEHAASVTLVPRDEQGRLWLVRQYRHAAETELLELPAGTLDPGETPEACAVRECREEIGMAPSRLTPLTRLWLVPGYSTEFMHFFLAESLSPSPLAPDHDEQLEVVHLTPAQAFEAIGRGEILDAKTVIGLCLAYPGRGG
jgi:ADP-ribose pyrophosphatase